MNGLSVMPSYADYKVLKFTISWNPSIPMQRDKEEVVYLGVPFTLLWYNKRFLSALADTFDRTAKNSLNFPWHFSSKPVLPDVLTESLFVSCKTSRNFIRLHRGCPTIHPLGLLYFERSDSFGLCQFGDKLGKKSESFTRTLTLTIT